MASTCPNASIVIGTPQSPATPADITTLQTAFEAFIGTLSDHVVATSGADYTVVKPSSGPGRYLFTFSPTKTIHTDQKWSADVELVAGHVWVGYSYDSVADDISNPWDGAANPFGSADFSKFLAATSVVATDNVASVYGSELVTDGGVGEALQVSFRKNTNEMYPSYAGAIFAQMDDDIADGVTKRIYGIATSQGVAMLWNALGSSSYFPGWSSTTDQAQTIARMSGSWVNAKRVISNMESGPQAQKSSTGKMFSIAMWMFDGDNNCTIGWLRNVRVTADSTDGVTINDIDGNPIGYHLSAQTGSAQDSLAFRSGTP
jgi:hypothetical protein